MPSSECAEIGGLAGLAGGLTGFGGGIDVRGGAGCDGRGGGDDFDVGFVTKIFK